MSAGPGPTDGGRVDGRRGSADGSWGWYGVRVSAGRFLATRRRSAPIPINAVASALTAKELHCSAGEPWATPATSSPTATRTSNAAIRTTPGCYPAPAAARLPPDDDGAPPDRGPEGLRRPPFRVPRRACEAWGEGWSFVRR
ncbi:hypothetical protein A7K94_0203945 [Modestobacter sp. VKM Ac-2676]|nr:hypothetical protein A7K94_0203945 [Modestobacter sp. VKM Ac-2676]